MSLQEAYSLAHTAQCRLNLAASRPDRNLRFVVGHLMHYESLRLRIVEIEHDIRQKSRTRAVHFQGTGQANDHRLQHQPSSGQLGRTSPPPPAETNDAEEDDEFDDDMVDDDEQDGLGLQRFPSGSSRPPQPPPDLEPDDYDDYEDEDDEPISPEEPDRETLEQAMKGDGNEVMVTMYEGVRKCMCNTKADAPSVERMWELPASDKEGVGVAGVKTRAIAQVA